MKVEITQEDGTKQIWEVRKPKGRELNAVMKIIDDEKNEYNIPALTKLLKGLVVKAPDGRSPSEINFEEEDAEVLLELFSTSARGIIEVGKKLQNK